MASLKGQSDLKIIPRGTRHIYLWFWSRGCTLGPNYWPFLGHTTPLDEIDLEGNFEVKVEWQNKHQQTSQCHPGLGIYSGHFETDSEKYNKYNDAYIHYTYQIYIQHKYTRVQQIQN